MCSSVPLVLSSAQDAQQAEARHTAASKRAVSLCKMPCFPENGSRRRNACNVGSLMLRKIFFVEELKAEARDARPQAETKAQKPGIRGINPGFQLLARVFLTTSFLGSEQTSEY